MLALFWFQDYFSFQRNISVILDVSFSSRNLRDTRGAQQVKTIQSLVSRTENSAVVHVVIPAASFRRWPMRLLSGVAERFCCCSQRKNLIQDPKLKVCALRRPSQRARLVCLFWNAVSDLPSLMWALWPDPDLIRALQRHKQQIWTLICYSRRKTSFPWFEFPASHFPHWKRCVPVLSVKHKTIRPASCPSAVYLLYGSLKRGEVPSFIWSRYKLILIFNRAVKIETKQNAIRRLSCIGHMTASYDFWKPPFAHTATWKWRFQTVSVWTDTDRKDVF